MCSPLLGYFCFAVSNPTPSALIAPSVTPLYLRSTSWPLPPSWRCSCFIEPILPGRACSSCSPECLSFSFGEGVRAQRPDLIIRSGEPCGLRVPACSSHVSSANGPPTDRPPKLRQERHVYITNPSTTASPVRSADAY